ncbi:predicted protein [Nematostella vectensis]|uniref:PH domain-containing protein n=1 Tax=Nematostella vectensis TaxID=45351 RepID=A7RQD9_NEMVE|nr:predicted protein [Nematostella vectensis]|eukprot:XP_001638336.1 predicted protein [Nematostella vectensis]
MAKGRSLREGIVQKRGNVFKKWRFRYLVLTRDTLCIFKKEEDEKRGRTEGRIFVMDIADIDKYNSKKKDFSFYLVAEGRTYYFCCASEIDRELWMRAIKSARSAEYKEEENDPIRRKSMKLTGGLKRITIQKEKGRGLGCTIKCIGGVIFVNRILEDGAVSSSGVLRPGE